jgi:hypothetical protein
MYGPDVFSKHEGFIPCYSGLGATAMNLRRSIFWAELQMFSMRSAPYLRRHIAKIVTAAALVAGSVSSAYADAIKIEAIFTGGVHGVGSFTTDGICLACTEVSGLSNFTFSVLDASFDDAAALIGNFTFTRKTLFVQSLFMKDSLSGDSINFTPIQPGPGTFSSVWIDSGLPKFSNNGTVTPVPEPSSLILPFTLLAITSKWRGRSLRHDG